MFWFHNILFPEPSTIFSGYKSIYRGFQQLWVLLLSDSHLSLRSFLCANVLQHEILVLSQRLKVCALLKFLTLIWVRDDTIGVPSSFAMHLQAVPDISVPLPEKRFKISGLRCSWDGLLENVSLKRVWRVLEGHCSSMFFWNSPFYINLGPARRELSKALRPFIISFKCTKEPATLLFSFHNVLVM